MEIMKGNYCFLLVLYTRQVCFVSIEESYNSVESPNTESQHWSESNRDHSGDADRLSSVECILIVSHVSNKPRCNNAVAADRSISLMRSSVLHTLKDRKAAANLAVTFVKPYLVDLRDRDRQGQRNLLRSTTHESKSRATSLPLAGRVSLLSEIRSCDIEVRLRTPCGTNSPKEGKPGHRHFIVDV